MLENIFKAVHHLCKSTQASVLGRRQHVVVAPEAGLTTLRVDAIVGIDVLHSLETAGQQASRWSVPRRHKVVSEDSELARGGCGAGRQRTIVAGHAEVAGTFLVAEVGDEAAVDGCETVRRRGECASSSSTNQ